MFQKIILWLGLVAVVVTGWLQLPIAFWQYVFFLRIPLLMGLLLFALPFLATGPLKSMLKNLFVLRNAGQIALTILGATVAGVAVTFVVAIILGGAPARFGVPELPGFYYSNSGVPELLLEFSTKGSQTLTPPFLNWDFWRDLLEIDSSKVWYYVLAIALALPTTLTVFLLSKEEIEEKGERWSGLFLGVSSGVIFLFLFKLTGELLSFNNFPTLNEWLAKAVSFLTKHSSAAGYINEKGYLKDNYFDAFVFFIVLLAIYIIGFTLFTPSSLPPEKKKIGEPPALLYVMLLISISVLLLGNLTFFFDYSRISVLFFWVVLATTIYRLLNVDHYFTLKDDPIKDDPKQSQEQTDFAALLQKRLDKQELKELKQTVVVVCASGGGIQAAGWTAQVLTGLQKELGESFTKALKKKSRARASQKSLQTLILPLRQHFLPYNTRQLTLCSRKPGTIP